MRDVVEPRIRHAFDDQADLEEIRVLQRRMAARVDPEVEPALSVVAPGVYADDPDLTPQQLAKMHGIEDALRLVALERWYASNSPEVRRLPHVLEQRNKLLGVAITGDRQMLDRYVPTAVTGGPPDGAQLVEGTEATLAALDQEEGHA